jgi:hypothetical protein
MSEASTADVLGRLLYELKDRLDPDFGAPSTDDKVELVYTVAWQVYAVGRMARNGHRAQRQRRLYNFRNRCGFTDAADSAFEQIWTGEDLSYADLTALVDTALAARESATA